MLKLLKDSDWQHAFEYAGEPDTSGNGVPTLKGALPDKEYDLTPFTREEVEAIAGFSLGEGDEQSWMCYGRLKDGRWFFLEAWCDYTGWDCRAGGSTTIASNESECIEFGLTDEARLRLMPVPDPLEGNHNAEGK